MSPIGKKAVVVAWALGVALAGPAFAATVTTLYSGTLSTADGTLIGANKWASNAQIVWDVKEVDADSNGTWDFYRYTYTITNANSAALTGPGISHVIVQVSDNFGLDDLLFSSQPLSSGGLRSDETDPLRWIAAGPGSAGNPNWPSTASISGAKFNWSGGTSLVLESLRQPMDGSIYVKGGSNSTLYNSGLANPTGAFLKVPDTKELPTVPLPTAAWGGLSMLGALAIYRSRRRLRQGR